MSEATQFSYSHKDLVKLMLKDQGIHEGFWVLLVNFGFGAVNAGPKPEEVAPTAMVSLVGLGIQRAPEMGPLVVDASVVNPGPK